MDRQSAEALALSALGWVLSDDKRAHRLLSLTGMDADDLRQNLTDPGVLSAVLDFLANHEPDLIKVAQALEIEPGRLLEIRESLSR